jgi:uncharacterized protein (TIGR04255 family)
MAYDPEKLPAFDRPPVVETVLGVQFGPIDKLTAGHYGWFWKCYLDGTWTKTEDAPPLPDQFEKFGDQLAWSLPKPAFTFQQTPEPERIVIVNEENDRVLQIQNNKFYYNWRKSLNAYPTFAETYPEFLRYLDMFEHFVIDAGLQVTPRNQWELTYVNHIPKGTLWESTSDWPAIFPGLLGAPSKPASHVICEGISGTWRFEILPRKGRLHVAIQHARNNEGQEVLLMNLTARGPVVTGDYESDLSFGINIGHDALVRTFCHISSDAALAFWGLR